MWGGMRNAECPKNAVGHQLRTHSVVPTQITGERCDGKLSSTVWEEGDGEYLHRGHLVGVDFTRLAGAGNGTVMSGPRQPSTQATSQAWAEENRPQTRGYLS